MQAESVDAVVSGAAGTGPRACFGTWVLYHVLRVMIAYLLSGLELELYSVHEYHYIFWSVCFYNIINLLTATISYSRQTNYGLNCHGQPQLTRKYKFLSTFRLLVITDRGSQRYLSIKIISCHKYRLFTRSLSAIKCGS